MIRPHFSFPTRQEDFKKRLTFFWKRTFNVTGKPPVWKGPGWYNQGKYCILIEECDGDFFDISIWYAPMNEVRSVMQKALDLPIVSK